MTTRPTSSRRQFVFNNPNQTVDCGCGESCSSAGRLKRWRDRDSMTPDDTRELFLFLVGGVRRMFGARVIYADGTMFRVVVDGVHLSQGPTS